MARVISSVGTGALGLATAASAVCLLEDGIEHLHDESLPRLWQLLDTLDLLLQFWRGSALGRHRSIFTDQIFEGDGERGSHLRQERNGDAPSADLVGSDHLLSEPQRLSELHLRQALIFAQGGDACTELLEE